MIVSLIGNMCTGKTTIGKELSLQLGWPLLSIDDYRPNPKGNHDRAYKLMAEDARRHKNVIVESLGISGRIYDVYRANGTKRLTVKLIAPLYVLKDRYHQRTGIYTEEISRLDSLVAKRRADIVYNTHEKTIEYITKSIVHLSCMALKGESF